MTEFKKRKASDNLIVEVLSKDSEATALLRESVKILRESEDVKKAIAVLDLLEKYGLVVRDNGGTLNIIFNPQETVFDVGGNYISLWKKQPLESAAVVDTFPLPARSTVVSK